MEGATQRGENRHYWAGREEGLEMALLSNKKMQVSGIDVLSQSAEEAAVTISDGEFDCVTFCQPCHAQVGDIVCEPLHPFDCKNVRLCDSTEVGIWESNAQPLARRVAATVVDAQAHLLAVGGLVLLLEEDLPGGSENGDTIEFECARIDLW